VRALPGRSNHGKCPALDHLYLDGEAGSATTGGGGVYRSGAKSRAANESEASSGSVVSSGPEGVSDLRNPNGPVRDREAR
jgi:hypothetical protein